MRKMNWLIGTIGLVIGIMIGILGFVFLSSSASGAGFINWGGNKTNDSVQTVGQQSNDDTATGGLDLNNSAENSLPGEEGSDDNLLSQGLEPDSTVQQNSDQNSGQSAQTPGTTSGQQESNQSKEQTDSSKSQVSVQLAQQIISDYKQDIGTFFEAWKSPDMKTFRSKLALAYSGELFEQHARRAESYLTQGTSLVANDITFNRVEVEQATNSTATLTADYTYMASDYSIADAQPLGVEHLQTVHVRVNLIKLNSRWLITGESIVQ